MAMRGRLPLLRLKLWTRAHGRFAAIMSIAFLNWSAFISFILWTQVCTNLVVGEALIQPPCSCTIKPTKGEHPCNVSPHRITS